MKTSEQINEIGTALAKAQATMPHAKMSRENPFYKAPYSTLADIGDAIQATFPQQGLSYSQGLLTEPGRPPVLVTLLIHSSGQWLSSSLELVLPEKVTPQTFKSSLTLLRRAALEAIAGITSNEDDDGNTASAPIGNQNSPSQQVSIQEPGDEVFEIGGPEMKGKTFAEKVTSKPFCLWVDDCMKKNLVKTHEQIKRFHRFATGLGVYQ